MDDFITAIKKDPKICKNINIMLNRYMSLPYEFQSKIGYNSLIRNIILKELINVLSVLIIDLDTQLKIKK